MKKYTVHHKDRDAIYLYFLSPHDDKYVLSVLYYDREGDWVKRDTIILNFKIHHIFAASEEDALASANLWVKTNLGPDFVVDEV